MSSLTYLAVLEHGEDGSYGISFPDLPGCFSFCDNLAEAGQMATEAAELHVYGMERDGEVIPTPSNTLPLDKTKGMFVMPVTIHPDMYRVKHDNKTLANSKTTYFAKLENSYVIIENVPCMKCEQCGEEFFTMSVLEKIDDILEQLEKIASKIFIMDYTTAA